MFFSSTSAKIGRHIYCFYNSLQSQTKFSLFLQFLFLASKSHCKMDYNFIEIEKKWQQYWRDNKIYKVDIDHSKPKFYVLDMFP